MMNFLILSIRQVHKPEASHPGPPHCTEPPTHLPWRLLRELCQASLQCLTHHCCHSNHRTVCRKPSSDSPLTSELGYPKPQAQYSGTHVLPQCSSKLILPPLPTADRTRFRCPSPPLLNHCARPRGRRRFGRPPEPG